MITEFFEKLLKSVQNFLNGLSSNLENSLRAFSFDLKEDEEVVLRSSSSIKGLIASYLMLPAFLLIYFIVFKLPQILRNAVVDAIKDEITGGSADGGGIFSGVVDAISNIYITACIIVWIAVCVVTTVRYFGYRLVITNFRVIGKARSKSMDVELKEVMNVHIEESIWGKIFGYGHITVRTKKQSLTFKNISNPRDVYKKLMSYAEKYFCY